MNITENTVEQQLIKAARHCAQALFDQPVAERQATFFERFRRRVESNDRHK
jgi:isopenicillin N synthase-like dioxygenase